MLVKPLAPVQGQRLFFLAMRNVIVAVIPIVRMTMKYIAAMTAVIVTVLTARPVAALAGQKDVVDVCLNASFVAADIATIACLRVTNVMNARAVVVWLLAAIVGIRIAGSA